MSYGSTELLKVDVVFNYDRYITIKNDPGEQYNPNNIRNLLQQSQQFIQKSGGPIPGAPKTTGDGSDPFQALS